MMKRFFLLFFCSLVGIAGTITAQTHFSYDLRSENIPLQSLSASFFPYVEVPLGTTFSLIRDETDDLGIRHQAYQQFYKGIKIQSCQVLVHSKGNHITSINGTVMDKAQVPDEVTARVPKRQAAQKVNTSVEEEKVEQVIINIGGSFYSAYKIPSPETYEVLYVDALTNDVMWRMPAIQNADAPCRGKTLYNGWQNMTGYEYSGYYFLIDSTRNIVTKAAPVTFDQTFTNNLANSLPDSIQQKILGGDRETAIPYLYTPMLQDYLDNQCSMIASGSSDFNITRLDKVTVSAANTSWWYDVWDTKPDLYLRILDASGNLLLQTATVDDVTFPVTFRFPRPILLTSPNYTIHIYDEDATSDSYGGYVTVSSTEEGTYTWSNASSTSGSLEIAASGYADIHWGMQKTLDFYKDKLHRNSYDNNGALVINVAFPKEESIFQGKVPNNANAQTEFEPYFMFYGYGDGEKCSPVVSLDVMAHEFTHLVTKFNGAGGLDYKEESGALNESFSDIMAMGVMQYTFGYCPWTIGEDISLQASNMRSMSNPKSSGSGAQPDTYLSPNYWKDTSNPSDKNDHGWVHINSGVQNYWFYLLSEGGNGTNDMNNHYSVAGIGIDKAIQIAYRNLIYYLTPSATYADSRNGSIQAAIDLFGKDSQEHQSVVNAWYAVGVGEQYVAPVEDVLCLANTNENVAFFHKTPDMGSNIYCYMWIDGSGTQITGAWPGKKTTALQNGYYKYTIPQAYNNPANTWRIIWHDNTGKQTADLIYTNHGLYTGTSYADVQCTTTVSNVCANTTDITTTPLQQTSATKIIRNGQILIRRGENIYTIQGQKLQ